MHKLVDRFYAPSASGCGVAPYAQLQTLIVLVHTALSQFLVWAGAQHRALLRKVGYERAAALVVVGVVLVRGLAVFVASWLFLAAGLLRVVADLDPRINTLPELQTLAFFAPIDSKKLF